MKSLDYSTQIEAIDGTQGDLHGYEGKVLLIVNTASKCGLTPQFAGLEALYSQHAEAGLVVLGFPCNQFAHQDPGSNTEIATFCLRNYGVSFPMHARIEVNGKQTHPLYEQLKAAQSGLLGTRGIKWNFTKFLVDRTGKICERFGPKTTPPQIEAAILTALAAPTPAGQPAE